jgi:hypothetical protein
MRGQFVCISMDQARKFLDMLSQIVDENECFREEVGVCAHSGGEPPVHPCKEVPARQRNFTGATCNRATWTPIEPMKRAQPHKEGGNLYNLLNFVPKKNCIYTL